jgi:steroid 5-alpha reductase family enzyme
MAGIVLAVIGILVESLADWQLSRFRADPSSRERIMDQGLWRYSRHPNYFGDALTWWGIFLVAAETQAGLWSLPGPLLLTFLLVRVSGIPTLEDHMTKHRPGYADYVRRTSAFVPWPPAA